MSDGFFRSRWVERPAHVTELEPDARCPRASAPPAWPPGSSRRALDVGVLVCDDAGHGVRRALHHATRAWARR